MLPRAIGTGLRANTEMPSRAIGTRLGTGMVMQQKPFSSHTSKNEVPKLVEGTKDLVDWGRELGGIGRGIGDSLLYLISRGQ